jgi:hypothetical protein
MRDSAHPANAQLRPDAFSASTAAATGALDVIYRLGACRLLWIGHFFIAIIDQSAGVKGPGSMSY